MVKTSNLVINTLLFKHYPNRIEMLTSDEALPRYMMDFAMEKHGISIRHAATMDDCNRAAQIVANTAACKAVISEFYDANGRIVASFYLYP